jgi:hypothetical protein
MNLNDNRVTLDLHISVGTIGKSRKEGRDLSQKNIEKILKFYANLNRVWLLTGEGEMLKKEEFIETKSLGSEIRGKHVKKIINRLKVAYGESDLDLSARLEVSQETLLRWEHEHVLDMDVIYAKCAGVSWDYLVYGVGPPFRLASGEDATTRDMIRQLFSEISDIKKEFGTEEGKRSFGQ